VRVKGWDSVKGKGRASTLYNAQKKGGQGGGEREKDIPSPYLRNPRGKEIRGWGRKKAAASPNHLKKKHDKRKRKKKEGASGTGSIHLFARSEKGTKKRGRKKAFVVWPEGRGGNQRGKEKKKRGGENVKHSTLT